LTVVIRRRNHRIAQREVPGWAVDKQLPHGLRFSRQG
jgi:hypothetical protein